MSLKVFVSVLILCLSDAFSYEETGLLLPARKPVVILQTLRKIESKSIDIYELSRYFDEAHAIFEGNAWEDPDDYVRLSRHFYRFLIELNAELSSDEFLTKRERYRNNTLFKRCHENHVKELKVGDLSLVSNLDDLKVIRGPDYRYVLKHNLDERKTSALCDTVVGILSIPQYNLTVSENATLRIVGDYVKASDISRLILAAVFNRELDIVERFTRAEIFASSKFLVDVNLGYGIPEILNVVIMAPVWSQPPGERDIYLEPLHMSVHVSDLRWAGLESLSLFGLGMQFRKVGGRSGSGINAFRDGFRSVAVYDVADRQVSKTNLTSQSYPVVGTIDDNFDYHGLMNDYLRFLLQKRTNLPSLSFLEKIYTYPYFDARMFNSMGFANELLILEDYYADLYRRNFTSQLESIYDTLDRRFDDYTYLTKLIECTPDYVKLHDAIRSAISSRLHALSSNHELELQLVTYISEGVGSSIKLSEVEQLEKRRAILLRKQSMQEEIVRQMRSVRELIEKEVGPQVDAVNEQIDQQLDLTIRSAIKLKETVEEEVFKRNAELATVRFFQLMKALGAVVGAVCAVMTGGFLTVAAIGGSVAAGAEFGLSEISVRDIELPGSVGNVQSIIDGKSLVLDRLLEVLGDREPRLLGELRREIIETRDQMMEGVGAAPYEKIQNLLARESKKLINRLNPGSLETLKEMQKILRIAQASSTEVYLKYGDNTTALEVLNIAAEQTGSSEIDAVNLYERTLHAVLVPGIRYLHNYTSSVRRLDDSKTLAEIDTLRWRTDNVLRDIQLRVEEFTTGVSTQRNFLRAVEKLKSALDLTFDLMSRISVYNEIMKLIGHIGEIHAMHFDKGTVDDPRIQDAINDLKYMTRYNVLITRSRRAINSYKLYAFPFTTMLHGLNSLGATTASISPLTTKSLAEHAVLQLGYLGLKMNAYKNSIIRDEDVDIMEDSFNGTAPFRQVFYRWKLAGSSKLLYELLGGREIELNADVNEGLRKNALKFKRIEIRLHSGKPAVQKMLDEALKFYNVKMTHSGDSYFRCDQGIYKVKSASIVFRYSLRRNAAGEPASTGASYKALLKGNYLLSPYTQWKVQIEGEGLGRVAAVKNLKREDIEIALVGYGQFVEGSAACSDDLPRYYEAVRK